MKFLCKNIVFETFKTMSDMLFAKRLVQQYIILAFALMMAAGCKTSPPPDVCCNETLDPDYDPAKKDLVVQIDEGVGGVEFVAGYCYSKQMLDMVLDNIYTALEPLKTKYNVSVLIYPTYYYNENGFGDGRTGDMARWDINFLYAMEYFHSKNIRVILESMSSGVYTNQNGELGNMPLVDINYGTTDPERRVKGLPADMAACKALKDAYPVTFQGLRFHELRGTNELPLSADPWWKAHGYYVYDVDLKKIIDTCAETGLELLWGDHSWEGIDTYNHATGAGGMTYCLSHWSGVFYHRNNWGAAFHYAAEKLGDKLTFMWNNNMAPGTHYHHFGLVKMMLAKYANYDIKGGMSVQNWYQTAIMLPLVGRDLGQDAPENDMPVELMAGFTLAAHAAGLQTVQYEAPYYFFNFHRNLDLDKDHMVASWHNATGAAGNGGNGTYIYMSDHMKNYSGPRSGYEKRPDYTPRLEMKRFTDMLLNDDTRFNDLGKYNVPGSTGVFYSNPHTETNPLNLFNQTSIVTYGNHSETRVFDKYNATESNTADPIASFTEDNMYRFGDWIFNNDVLFSTRIAWAYDNYDAVAIVKKGNNAANYVLEVYNHRSCLLMSDSTLLHLGEGERLVSIAAANIVRELVPYCRLDPDELVAAIEKNGVISFKIFTLTNMTASNSNITTAKINAIGRGLSSSEYVVFTPVDQTTANTSITQRLGSATVTADKFLKITGIRTRNATVDGRNRPAEGLLLFYADGCALTIKGSRVTGTPINRTVNLPSCSVIVDVAPADIKFNLGYNEDALVALNRQSTETWLTAIHFTDNTSAAVTGTSIGDFPVQPAGLVALKKAFYYNGSL